MGDDTMLALGRAWEEADLIEFLPVALQTVRWDEVMRRIPLGDSTPAKYLTNAPDVLFPTDLDTKPLGPAAIAGELVFNANFMTILLSEIVRSEEEAETAVSAFKFVAANELAHIFNALKFIAPASRDWPTFLSKALCNGSANQEAQESWAEAALFRQPYSAIDDASWARSYWGESADEWFSCFQALTQQWW